MTTPPAGPWLILAVRGCNIEAASGSKNEDHRGDLIEVNCTVLGVNMNVNTVQRTFRLWNERISSTIQDCVSSRIIVGGLFLYFAKKKITSHCLLLDSGYKNTSHSICTKNVQNNTLPKNRYSPFFTVEKESFTVTPLNAVQVLQPAHCFSFHFNILACY